MIGNSNTASARVPSGHQTGIRPFAMPFVANRPDIACRFDHCFESWSSDRTPTLHSRWPPQQMEMNIPLVQHQLFATQNVYHSA